MMTTMTVVMMVVVAGSQFTVHAVHSLHAPFHASMLRPSIEENAQQFTTARCTVFIANAGNAD